MFLTYTVLLSVILINLQLLVVKQLQVKIYAIWGESIFVQDNLKLLKLVIKQMKLFTREISV